MDLPSRTRDMIYLSACALTGKKADPEKVKGMDLDEVFFQSGRHKVRVLVAMGLATLPDSPEKALGQEEWARWQEEIDANIRRTMIFDEHREEICAFFEKEKIWYLPLKGIHIKELYPQYGMREFADNDILIDPSAMDETCDFMESIGYECLGTRMGRNHDVYTKEPFLNFEIHRILFVETWEHMISQYYANVKDRLLRVSEDSWEYRFTDEDFYVYFLAHAFQHYTVTGGTGMRAIFDCAMIHRAYPDLSREYLDEVLSKLGMAEFEKTLYSLAEKIVNDPEHIYSEDFPEEEEKMLLFMAGSGAYGTFQNKIDGRILALTGEEEITRFSKVKYVFLRIFPPWHYMLVIYPWLKKVPFLLPIMYIWRLLARIILIPKMVKKEWKMVRRKRTKEEL